MKFNPDNLNIHELAIEEPEKESEVFFDPEKDITPEDWKIICNEVNGESINIAMISGYAKGLLKLLGKKSVLSDKEIDELKEQINHGLGLDEVDVKAAVMAAIMGEKNLLSNAQWEKIEKDYMSLYNTTCASAIIAGKKLSIATEEKTTRFSQLTSERFNEDAIKRGSVNASDIENLVAARILGVKVEITNDTWLMIKAALKEMKETIKEEKFMWDSFIMMASDVAILAADEIKIPEGGGLELIRHKKTALQPETPQMPEQKQF